MSDYHLYILQCNYARIETALSELSQICVENDVLVLMEDAIFALHSPLITQFKHLRVLGDDHQLLEQYSKSTSHHTTAKVDYDELSDLIQHSTKTHCWR